MIGLGLGLSMDEITSGFVPTDLGSTLILWLQNTETGGISSNASGTDGTSANRMTWKDTSGNNNHAFQDTTANKPTIEEGGMDFELDEADHLDLVSNIDVGHPNAFTLSVVVKRESTATQTTILGGASTEFVTFKSSDDKIGVRGAGTNATNNTITFAESNLWPIDTKFILTVTKSADGILKFYKNGAIKAESSGSNSVNQSTNMDFNVVGTKIGSTGAFDGIIYEIILCDTVLSDEKRDATVAWLKQYI